MPYERNLMAAARRHLEAANDLKPPCSHRRDVAGYLYGLAAELAVKAMMLESQMYKFANDDRRDNPFYAHFPELKTLLRDNNFGRRSGELRRIADDTRLMQNWSIRMRYARGTEIRREWVDQWEEQATDLVNRMDL